MVVSDTGKEPKMSTFYHEHFKATKDDLTVHMSAYHNLDKGDVFLVVNPEICDVAMFYIKDNGFWLETTDIHGESHKILLAEWDGEDWTTI